MSDTKTDLELRKQIKKKKPTFLAQDVHKKKRIRRRWVKPRGSDSKMRVGFRGYRKSVKVGYGSPISVKGFHPSGLRVVTVATLGDLEGLDAKADGILLSASVGMKKRLQIVKKAKELGVTILNVADDYVTVSEEKLKTRKQTKKSADEEKKKKEEKKEQLADKVSETKEAESKKSETKKSDDAAAPEEKKKEEVQKRDKMLTKRV